MEKLQKTSIVPIVITFLVIGGVVYLYETKTTKTLIPITNTEVLPLQPNQQNNGQSNSTANSESLYYTYVNQKGLYSVDLPNGWGYVDTDSTGKATFGLQAFPSVNKHMTASEEFKMRSSIREIIQIYTITPKDADALKKEWALSQQLPTAEVPNRSSLIKELKMDTGQGSLDNCNGFEYKALTENRIYLFVGCTKDESNLTQIKDYLVKMIQTLKDTK